MATAARATIMRGDFMATLSVGAATSTSRWPLWLRKPASEVSTPRQAAKPGEECNGATESASSPEHRRYPLRSQLTCLPSSRSSSHPHSRAANPSG